MRSDDDSIFDDDVSDLEMSHLLKDVAFQDTNKFDCVSQKISKRKSTEPTHHTLDYESLKTFIYPTNLELRSYQLSIVQRAFYDNLLVALPTGLGKTFIASTVMLNFSRWFPEAKMIFMAPTKPLVAQQIKACCGITGISQQDVAILLYKSKRNRAEIWENKKVFFTTPQVVENDLCSGILNPKSISLLVIDEAHRSRGNYAYNNVVKFLNRFNHSFRILALTATPASDVDGVQEIVHNLSISKIEVRTEQSVDIIPYLKRRKIKRVSLSPTMEIENVVNLLCEAVNPTLKMANERKIYDITDPRKINAFQVMEASQRLIKNPTIPEGLKWQNYFILQILNTVGQCLRRLFIYGIRSFFNYFSEKHKEFTTKFNKKKSTNKLAAAFYFHENITLLLNKCEKYMLDTSFLSHPKLETLIAELTNFFNTSAATDSKVIIFTEFRESALEIVQVLEQSSPKIRPHIFIGQSKEKEKFGEESLLSKRRNKMSKVIENSRDASRSSSENAQIHGMNQKLQKKLIADFKTGRINTLVATSIGEEGLDIGEVDLIVCFDSTSSPIKNVQRMGRTGRKRDGTILLLFSSNEEAKFDKAMGGYEYVQQHVMKNDVIALCPNNRILPKHCIPVIQKRFIEIPSDNIRLKSEEDEDEIIRIASSYMNKSIKNIEKGKNSKNQKRQKQFFMPDNVEHGFQKVTDMLSKSNTKKDDITMREGSNSGVESKNQNHRASSNSQTSVTNFDFATIPPVCRNGCERVMSSGTGVSNDKNVSECDLISTADIERREPSFGRRNIGVKRRHLDKDEDFCLKEKTDLSDENDADVHLKSSSFDLSQSSIYDGDVFDDGLDGELSNLAKDKSPTKKSSGKEGTLLDTKDQIYDHEFKESFGFLDSDQELELYTSYYTMLNPSQQVIFYDPSHGLELLECERSSMSKIGHSRRTLRLMKSQTHKV